MSQNLSTSTASPTPTSFATRYGPWALVLGGSEGIGECFARRIAADGVNVVLVARRTEPLEAAAVAIRDAHGVEVRTASVDLTADDVGARLAAATDGLDVGLVVYNAGAGSGVPKFLETTREQALALVRLNCNGPVEVAQHFGPGLVARGRGGLVFVTSMAAVVGAARTVTYGATKAFDLVFAEGLWAELAPQGVDVLAVVAGATDTPALAATGANLASDAIVMMSADDVAREGLEHLGDGPTWVPGEANRAGFDFLRAMPRADAVNLLSAATRSMYGFDD